MDNGNVPRDRWGKIQSLSTILSIVAVPIIVAYIGTSIQAAVKEKDVSLKTVEIAISILSKPPTEAGDAALREWATQVISRHSIVPLSEMAQTELVLRGLPTGYIADLNPTSWGFGPATSKHPLIIEDSESKKTIPLISYDKRSATLELDGIKQQLFFGIPWRPTDMRCVVYLMAITRDPENEELSGPILSWACE